MKLVDNAKSWYKMFSVQANALNISFLATWGMLPEKFQSAIPISVVFGIAAGLLVLGTIGRLVKQDSVNDSTKQ
jgi:uncharacterized membrane protein (UPF0136 family)